MSAVQTSVRFREGIRGIELELMVREEFYQNITLSKIYGCELELRLTSALFQLNLSSP